MSSTKSQRVFLTGGTGFVGRAILSRLQSTHPDWILFSYDRIPPLVNPSKPQNPAINHDKVNYLTGDITDLPAVQSALTQASPTLVIHTAGFIPPLADRHTRRLQDLTFKTNIDGTKTLLTASRATPSVTAFVWTGSCCAVIDDTRFSYTYADESWRTTPKGSTIYGESKARAEALVLAANDPEPTDEKRKGKAFLTAALRPCVLFGPEDCQFIPSIHACIAKGEMPYILGNGLNLWDVADVRNVAHAHVLAAENLLSSQPTAAGEAFFTGNGAPIPLRDFCREVWKQWDAYPAWEVHVPEGVGRVFAGVTHFVGSWLGLKPTLTPGTVADGCAMRYCSEKKALAVLGYRPIVGLEEGIRESCEAYKVRLEEAERPKGKIVKAAGRGEKVKI